MNNLYCVRAEFGTYTNAFLKGNYVAIGWLENIDLSDITTRDELYPIYKAYYPSDTSNVVIGQQVGQIGRFLLEIKEGDFVITPASNTEVFYWGIVASNTYYFEKETDGCPYPHRKTIHWNKTPVRRAEFSVPFQNTIRSSLTVYKINHTNNFFEVIGKKELVKEEIKETKDYYEVVLNRILELDPTEFEILVTHILSALGFEAQHTGKVHDNGIDVEGTLNIDNIASIKLFVQVKRYQLGEKLSGNVVKALRQNIHSGAQGAFITTADYRKEALEIATEPGFPRIGTINGRQLVDLLSKNWNKIPEDFQEKLGLKIGLVVA